VAVTPLRVVFAGTPEVAVPSLRALVASEHEVVGVIARPDAPTGRGRRMRACPVAEVARELSIPLTQPASLTADSIDAQLRHWRPDVVIVVAYGLLIPGRLLDLPRFGWVNAHFSALPRWRGAAPVQYAIAAGDESVTVTTFRIDEGLDTGPVLASSEPIAIGDRDDSGRLLTHLADVAARLVVSTVDQLAAGTAASTPQETEGVSYAPRIGTDDARIDWSRPVDEVDRWIRACTPSPGAWTTFAGTRIRIGTPRGVIHGSSTPRQIITEKHRVLVGAADGFLDLGMVQPMGKQEMAASDWARGLREAAPGEFDA
jgi:methionyl-tRNA formyltransferase